MPINQGWRLNDVGNTPPVPVHATLTQEEIGSGRIIVIGDIHGCSEELDDLLRKWALIPNQIV